MALKSQIEFEGIFSVIVMIGRNKETNKPTCESGGGLEGEVVGSDGRECERLGNRGESQRDVKTSEAPQSSWDLECHKEPNRASSPPLSFPLPFYASVLFSSHLACPMMTIVALGSI